jgi:hypothetical protein
MGTDSTVSNNLTYTYVAAGGGGGCPKSGCPPPFNYTACNLESKQWGDDCACLSCGIWVGYDTRGFYNLTGVYYDDGTPTGMTLKQMETFEELNANYRYSKFMAEHGVLV